jgi:1-acyl-sn-glycerol-3-phosphate acyltransferase
MRPCVFVGNHQSMVDVLVLGRCVISPVLLLHSLIVPIACFLWGLGYWPKNR